MLYHVIQKTVAQITLGPPGQGEQQVEQYLIPVSGLTLIDNNDILYSSHWGNCF